MADRAEFSQAYMRAPGKAAAQLAAKRKRIAELEAGAASRPWESIDEHRKVAERLVEAFRHGGRCEDCGKPLADPVSIERGYGPDCARKRDGARVVTIDPDAPF